MMGWNYRILEDEYGTLGIHEVYYGDAGDPQYCTADPIDLAGFSDITDLLDTLEMMKRAVKLPILSIEDF